MLYCSIALQMRRIYFAFAFIAAFYMRIFPLLRQRNSGAFTTASGDTTCEAVPWHCRGCTSCCTRTVTLPRPASSIRGAAGIFLAAFTSWAPSFLRSVRNLAQYRIWNAGRLLIRNRNRDRRYRGQWDSCRAFHALYTTFLRFPVFAKSTPRSIIHGDDLARFRSIFIFQYLQKQIFIVPRPADVISWCHLFGFHSLSVVFYLWYTITLMYHSINFSLVVYFTSQWTFHADLSRVFKQRVEKTVADEWMHCSACKTCS